MTNHIISKLMLVLLSYLIGSLSPSYFIGKYFFGFDIRTRGSKNPGSTNSLRTMGKFPALIIFIIDVLKGSFATYIGYKIYGEDFGVLCGFASVIGHSYPFYLGFKGGKGVATTMGVALVIGPELLLVGGFFGIGVLIIFKMVSLASICGFTAIGLMSIYKMIIGGVTIKYMIFLALSIISIYKHRSNIERILAGKENKIGVKK